MARRRKNGIEGVLLLFVALVGGGVWLLDKGGTAIRNADAGTVASVSYVAAILLGLAVLRKLLMALWENRIRRSLIQKTKNATQQHVSALSRRRMQLLQPDAYGKLRVERWSKELDYFLSEHLRPTLSVREQAVFPLYVADLRAAVELLVSTAIESEPALQAFCDNMTPAEFEGYCAEELRQAGWNARVTLQSRDQGVDVVAEKNGVRIVVQCKLYSGPVGNKAVQEAAAGRAHEKADYGAVVTNNRYTSAAEQLAATNSVLLIHYRDLRNIEALLPPRKSARVPTISIGETVTQMNGAVQSSQPRFDQVRWDTLLRRDPQLGLIANKLQPLGRKWVDRFAASYLIVNDRNQLPAIVKKIIADARIEHEQERGIASKTSNAVNPPHDGSANSGVGVEEDAASWEANK
jgi:HJR/Mrr/RecB family endonuclease